MRAPLLSMLMTDFYKIGHIDQYPSGTEYVISNWTARATRVPGVTHTVHFGLQYALKEIDGAFRENFFDVPLVAVLNEYKRVITQTLGVTNPRTDHIAALWKKRYLPIKIYSLPEGSSVPLRVPSVIVVNTDPEFFWVVNFLESILSNYLWKPTTSATTAKRFRKVFEAAAKRAGHTDLSFTDWQGHDFSFRGMSGLDDAVMSGMGHLTSFKGTDTIPAVVAVREYYNTPNMTTIGGSVPATEHSVMCAGSKEDEQETFNRIINEIYPSGIVSVVSDTWDLWNVLTVIIPNLKKSILLRDGKVVIRPDSGDPVKIVTGDDSAACGTPQNRGALSLLWSALGGTQVEGGKTQITNGGIIYGDGISVERAESILSRAIDQGFSPYNVVFGIGSYTYERVTRDEYGHAMKATAIVQYGQLIPIFKDPITDDGLKKSLKGIPGIYGSNGDYHVVEGISLDELENTAMELVYENGKLLIDEDFETIRQRVREV